MDRSGIRACLQNGATDAAALAGERSDPQSVRQLIEEGMFNGVYDWWETPGAAAVVNLAKIPGLVVALAGLVDVLREGLPVEWVIGGETAEAAVGVAIEWLDAGVDPTEVASWLRAGCWSAEAARRMVGVGIHPNRLLNDKGEPCVLVDEGPDEPIPLAQAVADNYLTAEQAARELFARAGRRVHFP